MAGELPPRRMVSSSSGVGGRGLLGPLAGTPTLLTLCSCGAPTPPTPAPPAPELLWGRNSRSGLGFRSDALMVPSKQNKMRFAKDI